MNSGRSFGRQAMSSLVDDVADDRAADALTAGDTSAFTKCSGTFMWIFLFASTRWKSMCRTCWRYGCICTSRSSTSCAAPPSFIVRIEAWKASFLSAWISALWSSSIGVGAVVPP